VAVTGSERDVRIGFALPQFSRPAAGIAGEEVSCWTSNASSMFPAPSVPTSSKVRESKPIEARK
jgi:hypothetical protein